MLLSTVYVRMIAFEIFTEANMATIIFIFIASTLLLVLCGGGWVGYHGEGGRVLLDARRNNKYRLLKQSWHSWLRAWVGTGNDPCGRVKMNINQSTA